MSPVDWASHSVKAALASTGGVLLLGCVLFGCQDERAAPPAANRASAPDLPSDDAGRVVARAIAASGGWEAWRAHRDASFVSTLTLFDPFGNATSETIFLHKLPLHDGMKTRLESIGLPEELMFGFDGHESWMFQDGRAITEPARKACTEFHGISTLYWFELPFVLAELPGDLKYLGAEQEGEQHWEKVRVDYHQTPAAPADWMVFYFDAQSGLLDQVLSHVTVEFLRHGLWLGKWRDYRNYGGIKRERRRTFFPADVNGASIGGMAAEQIVEHVTFDMGWAPELFVKPLVAGGGSPAG